MPRKSAPKRESAKISRGNVPIEREKPVPPAPPPPPDPAEPTPEDREKLVKRGTLMAILYAEFGSYNRVAELLKCSPATVRWWVHETRKYSKAKIASIAEQLKGDVAQLAVDRVVEGLVEGETQFAADLGRRVLHGLGELKAHSAVKNDTPPGDMKLTFVFEQAPANNGAGEVVEGAVLGVGRQLVEAQTSAVDPD